MTQRTRLIVNADDFGRSPAINRGVVRAHREGIVTSASLMVRYAAAAQAATQARAHPRLGLGLHLDLDEWHGPAAPEQELARQLDEFRRLAGREPTHVDSHHHVHREEPVRTVVERAAAGLGVPVRHGPGVRYCGAFYGQDSDGTPRPDLISARALIGIIDGLAAGITELACHPAAAVDFESSYALQRPLELRALCDVRVRQALGERDVELCNFGAVTAAAPP